MTLLGDEIPIAKDRTLIDLFHSTVSSHPLSIAIAEADGNNVLTYQKFNEKANQLARFIVSTIASSKCKNPDNDRVVAVCMAPSTQLVVTLLAIQKAGAAYLPLDVTFPASRVSHILQDAKPALLLAMGRPRCIETLQLEKLTEISILHLEDFQEQLSSQNTDNLAEHFLQKTTNDEPRSSSIAMILYTSGSTGVPKGVRLSHRAALNRLSWQWRSFPYRKDEVCCFKTALTFVDSISEIFGPLLTGHKVIVIPKIITQAVDDLVNLLEKESMGRIVLVPSLLRAILAYCSMSGTPKLASLHLWVCSGEVFPFDLLQSFFRTFKNGQKICNFYGSTEVLGDVTFIEFGNMKQVEDIVIEGKVPIGNPLDNCRIYLLDTELKIVKEDQIGEIFAAGMNIASGYVGGAQPDKFILNPFSNDTDFETLYRTGDYGRIAKGTLLYEGRTDSQVKIRGHRIDLNEVQMALQSVHYVDKVTVLVYKTGEVEQALLAFFTSDHLSKEELKRQLGALLPPYMQPQLMKLDEMPFLVNGKVDRQHLLKMYDKESFGPLKTTFQIVITGIEESERKKAEVLLNSVAKIIGGNLREKLSLDHGFFDVGGNSLNAVLAVTSLQDFGYQIGMRDFLKSSTLRQVLEELRFAPMMEKTIDEVCPKIQNEKSKIPLDDIGDAHPEGYVCEAMKDEHKDTVLHIISNSFSQKGDLEKNLRVEPWEYLEFLTHFWDEIVKQKVSFVVRSLDSKVIVAASLSFDLNSEPPVVGLTKKLSYVFAFLEHCETSVRKDLPSEVGEVIHSFMMGTSLQIPPGENVLLVQVMEEQNLRLAHRYGFKAIFTTNTSDLTQFVCDDLLGYTVLFDQQINQWCAADGVRPFAAAPDDRRAVVTVRYVNNKSPC